MKTVFIYLFIVVPLSIAVFGFSIGYSITVHPALAIVVFLLCCSGLYCFDKTIKRRKERRIENKLEQISESIAATQVDAPWKLVVFIRRWQLFIMNPGLPFLILMLSIEYNQRTLEPVVTGFGILFFLYYVLVIALNLPGNKSYALVLCEEGVETFCNGYIPWSKIEYLKVESVNFRGVDINFLCIKVDSPETTLVRHHWKDRFLALFRLGAKKHGIVRLSMDYASEEYDVVETVANAFLRENRRRRKPKGARLQISKSSARMRGLSLKKEL